MPLVHKSPNMSKLGMRSVSILYVTACIWLGLNFTMASAQEAKGNKPSTLPGGASSLNETFEDWTVSCASTNGKTQCVVSQTQSRQNGQRVLDIRLSPVTADDGNNGTLVLPFGLELARGVTAQLDEGKAGNPFSFKTCLPAGCIVPLSLDKPILDAMRKGTNLKLNAVSIENQAIPFTVSLKGFAQALDRAAALMAAK